MLLLSLFSTPADAVTIGPFQCNTPTVITTISGCVTAEPTLEFQAFGQSLNGSSRATIASEYSTPGYCSSGRENLSALATLFEIA